MAKLYLSKKAVDDLAEIWKYTNFKWSEYQADKYYFSLINTCKDLSQKILTGKMYKAIGANIFGYKSGNHIVFYRNIEEGNVEILRFLHSRMDIKSHILD